MAAASAAAAIVFALPDSFDGRTSAHASSPGAV